MPEQPKRQRKSSAEFVPFDGQGEGGGRSWELLGTTDSRRRLLGKCKEGSGDLSQQLWLSTPAQCAPQLWWPGCTARQSALLLLAPTFTNAVFCTCLTTTVVVERRTTAGGAEYIRVVLGTKGGAAAEVEDASAVIDAEFLFLSGGRKAAAGPAQLGLLDQCACGSHAEVGGCLHLLDQCACGSHAEVGGSLHLLDQCARGSHAVAGAPSGTAHGAAMFRAQVYQRCASVVTLRCAALRCAGDNLVNIRASSRAEPEGRLGSGGQLGLSLREGFVINRWAGGRQTVLHAAGAHVQQDAKLLHAHCLWAPCACLLA